MKLSILFEGPNDSKLSMYRQVPNIRRTLAGN